MAFETNLKLYWPPPPPKKNYICFLLRGGARGLMGKFIIPMETLDGLLTLLSYVIESKGLLITYKITQSKNTPLISLYIKIIYISSWYLIFGYEYGEQNLLCYFIIKWRLVPFDVFDTSFHIIGGCLQLQGKWLWV